MKFNRDSELGRGSYGKVFKGNFYEKQVAVKRIKVKVAENPTRGREEEEQIKLNHENVVKLIFVDDEKDSRYR